MIDVRNADQMEWLQEAIYYVMLSSDLFARLNIVLEKKFRLDKSVELAAIWQTPRGGSTGAGLLVEMPKLTIPLPNSQVNNILGSVVVFEERNLNGTNAGTGKSAEQWAQLAVEFMRGWIIGQSGGINVEANAIVTADDWAPEESGVIALRGSVSQKVSRPNYTRTERPALTLNGLEVTLGAVAGAEIWFTTDGSVPRSVDDDEGNAPSRYTAPFTVASGTLVQWIALASGKLPSHIGSQIIT